MSYKKPLALGISQLLALYPHETPSDRIRIQLIFGGSVIFISLTFGIVALRNLYRIFNNGASSSQPSFFTGILIPTLLPILLYTIVTDALAYMNDFHLNSVTPYAYSPSSKAIALHDSLDFIADLHADTLLWTHRGNMMNPNVKLGHVDLERLIQGRVALQVFSSVTMTPNELNTYKNSNKTDAIRTLGIIQKWPMKTVFGHSARMERVALYASELEKMQQHTLVDSSHGQFIFVKNRNDLDRLLTLRKLHGTKIVGGLLSIEGSNMCHPNWISAADCANRLWELGVRMVGITHFVDIAVGSSATGENDYGLTQYGKDYVNRLLELGFMIDISHTGVNTIDDLIILYDKYVEKNGHQRLLVVSHTGFKSACNHNRNLEDRHAKAIAHRGGIIGVAFFPEVVCGDKLEDIIKSYKVAINLTSIDHVVLGSDYDGAVRMAFDVADLAYMTHGLLEAKLSDADIRKIMGGNIRDRFEASLQSMHS